MAQSVAISAVTGSEAYIDEQGLNAMVAYLIQSANDRGLFSSDCRLTAAYIEINTGKPCKIYFQIEYKEKRLGFSADADIFIDDGSIKLSFDNAYVGKLKIPRSLIITALSKTNWQNTTDYLSLEDLSLTLPTHYSLDIDNVGTIVTIDITQLTLYDGTVYIKTNPILGDMIDNIKDIIGEDTFNSAKNKIQDFIGRFHE